MLRSHRIGELNESLAGEKVKLSGWADTIREHGAVVFIDLRDRYGKVQTVVNKKNEEFEKAKSITKESCLQIEGEVKKRPAGTEKGEGPGKIEISIEKLTVLSEADQLPFDLERKDVNEDTRLKYRYLDLRRPEMAKNMRLRHDAMKFIRDYLDSHGFLELQTPILTKSTPEGARDYIVPSRVHPGKFYALPQAPQQYKQLLMAAGMDKYFQIAPCFRDEDPRAHRSPGEFYQIDMEMSFADQEDILQLTEDMMIKLVKNVFPEKKIQQIPFPRIPYDEAMKKYNSDKPDLRENKDDPNELAFAWIVDFPLFVKQSEEDYFHGAGENLAPSHHMFTAPKKEDLHLLDTEPEKARSYQHDLVLNGLEVGGGSVRIHDRETQSKIFDIIGFTEKQKEEFAHLLRAFKYGVPPHGGIAPGLDRLLMGIMGTASIRDLIAFPKNREVKDLTVGAPSEITERQLKDANIELNDKAKEKLKKEGQEKTSENSEENYKQE